MKEVTLAASPRASVGKGPARQARMRGSIPAVVYGPEVEPMPVEVDVHAFRTAIKAAGSTSAILNLKVNGKTNKVIIREIQRDPVTSNVMHIDFHAISMTQPIHVAVPIRFVGTARGVKTEGGILQTTMRELEVSCLPAQIPDRIEVDVAELGIGDSIHVRDLEIPDVKILSELRRTVVVISAPTVVKVEAEAAEEEVEAEAAEVAEGAEEAEGAAEEGAKADQKGEKEEKKRRKPK